MDSLRDWGHAKDYVRAQWLILQQEKPDDFVIATGEQHSVREFVVAAGAELGMQVEWKGTGVDEQGIDVKTGNVVVMVDPRYFRPTEVETLLGDPSKAKSVLGWAPEHTFHDLVREMVASDLEIAHRDAVIAREGFKTYRYFE
jgi:GDPmannose 4,6-dehydratase